MDSMHRKKNAAAFAAEWSGRGYEKGDAQVFWTELLQQIVGMQNISRNVRFEYRTASGGFIDCLIPDAGVIVEQKGLDIDLDKPEERQGRMVTPFEQALAYAESFPRNRQPRFVVVCNFSTFRVHDRDACPRSELAGQYVEFTLEELGRNPHLLDFVADPANSRSEREKQVSMEAGRLIGELHSLLQAQYIDPESDESQKALNILCVRLVCGRLKSDYRYSGGVVYNNFVWPKINSSSIETPVEEAVTPETRLEVERCAQSVLDVRKAYDGSTMADLYDPDNEWMFPGLINAHRELDAAVEEAYGVNFQGDEEKIVAHLFKLYAELTNE